MELDELINLFNRERTDYVKIAFADQLNNTLISITTVCDDGLYERIFKQVNGNGPYKQLLSFRIFEYKTLDEYYNAMKDLYSRNKMDAKIDKIIHEE
jgi:hypothetical protein